MFNVVSPFVLSDFYPCPGVLAVVLSAGEQGFPVVFDLARRREGQKPTERFAPFPRRNKREVVAPNGKVGERGRAPGRSEVGERPLDMISRTPESGGKSNRVARGRFLVGNEEKSGGGKRRGQPRRKGGDGKRGPALALFVGFQRTEKRGGRLGAE